MTEEEIQRKIEDLKVDHVAAGGFISHEDAEKIIRKVYDSEPHWRIKNSSSSQ